MSQESSAETISRVLSAYDLGAKLRKLRLKKKLGLKELGQHTGLSASMLSQLETGRMVPTLPTLARIAMVFDVGLEFFFEKRPRKVVSVARACERIRLPERADAATPAYHFECLAFAASGKSLQAYLAEFPYRPRKSEIGHFHEGAEFLFVIEGQLALAFGEEEVVDLAAGDSAYFDATEPHTYWGGPEGARAIVITVPTYRV